MVSKFCRIAALSILLPAIAYPAIPAGERDALLALYNSTNGPAWLDRTGWGNAPGTECDWYGIQCNELENTVITLSLSNNNLVGTLPPQISGLTNLEFLDFDGDELSGPIPEQVGQLSHLKLINFARNKFSGTIPTQLADLAQLEFLFLHGNQLTGSIPPELARLTQLQLLYLSSNQLTGSIPPELGDMPALEDLVLDTNQLTGEIPVALTRLPVLRALHLHSNQLSGNLPPQLGDLTRLEELFLSSNRLTGPIPAELGQMQSLIGLTLAANGLEGPIPPQLAQLANLDELLVFSNRLTGSIPTQLAQMPKLRILYLGDNLLTGSIPRELGQITTLEELALEFNQLEGPIPDELGALTNLKLLTLNQNRLSGPVPLSLTTLPNLEHLYLYSNELTGPVPPELGRLTNLKTLLIGGNELTGPIPPQIYTLTNLTYLDMGGNPLGGGIDPQIGNLTQLEYLSIEDALLSGPLPRELGNLESMREIRLDHNRLSGPLPPLGRLKNMSLLLLSDNELGDTIPTDIGDLTAMEILGLGQNKFRGQIPPQIGNLTQLRFLDVEVNALRNPIPREILNLTQLLDGSSRFGFNALSTDDPTLREFLNRKSEGRDFEATQTVTPANFRISGTTATTAILSWDPTRDLFSEGGYQVTVSTSPGGPAVRVTTTTSKTFAATVVNDLTPQTSYFFTVRTVTYPNDFQKNLVVSDPSPTLSASTTAAVPSPPQVVVTSFPFGLVQSEGEGQDRPEDFYVLSNFGDTPTTLTLTQEGTFFTQDPTTLTLGPGEDAGISFRAVPQPSGAYRGASIPTGAGVPAGLRVPVHLLSVVTPTGTVIAQAAANRIDIAAAADVEVIAGTATFNNAGNATLNGILVADVGWLIPQTELVVIAPGQSTEVRFQIDRRLRDDHGDGTATGTLSLLYLQATSTSAAQLRLRPHDNTTSVSTAVVTVVDTVKPPASATTIPPIVPPDVALLIPGVGHVVGGGGRFLSDLSIANAFGITPLGDVRIIFTPESITANSTAAPLESLQPNTGTQLGDVVKSVFNGEGQVGTLQIRTAGWERLAVSANIFNVSNPAGTYGTVIPVFRSDRTTQPGQRLFLTGLRKTATTRTNIFMQETSGANAAVQIEFFNAAGAPLGTIHDTVPPFRMKRVIDQVPNGAVTARLTNSAASAGRIVAYATPVDQASGDFWSVADWSQQFAASRTEASLIPVAGTVRGANDTFFRTDMDVANVGSTAGSAVLSYYPQGGSPIERTISIAAGATSTFSDVIGDLFGLSSSLGYIIVQPRQGEFAITSRTYATMGNAPGTFGSGTPTVPIDAALRLGKIKVIGGLEIASSATIAARKPGTFRTNIGLIETSGQAVTVRVTVFYADARAKAFGPLKSFEFELQPSQSRLITNLNTLLEDFTRADLRNAQLQFDIVRGDGAVIIYTSSVDNGTGDSIFRLE